MYRGNKTLGVCGLQSLQEMGQARREGGTTGTFSRGPQPLGGPWGPIGSKTLFPYGNKGNKSNIQEVLQGHSLFLDPLLALLWHSGALLKSLVAPSLYSEAPQGPPFGPCRGSWALWGPLLDIWALRSSLESFIWK